MKMGKAVSWILSLMLVFTMIPALGAVAYAEDGGAPAISLGAGNIEKGNKVYMGIRYVQESPAPISWIVLGNANSTDLKSNGTSFSSENARLLITEKTQGDDAFDMDGQSNTWQGSSLQEWCVKCFLNETEWDGSQYQDIFTELEKGTMLSTSKSDAESIGEEADSSWGTSSLDNETLFLLSAEEASDGYGYFNGDETRIAYNYNEDNTRDWWLRSPSMYFPGEAFCVEQNGSVRSYVTWFSCDLRPAFNSDLTSVLFTSAAEGGKSSGTFGADALKAITDNTTNEWKLTLKDASRSGFEASAAAGATLEVEPGYSDWSVPIVYSGAKTGDDEYVSVILCDSCGIAKYYGNIANNSEASSESGQIVNIPAGLETGDYTMYVFSEQINGDKRTDYASEFSTIDLMVKQVPGGDSTVTYSNVSGEGNVWYKGSDATSDFAFKRSIDDASTISHFTGIRVDSNAIDAANYTKEPGSVIIKLKPEYLETLALGKHTLEAWFDDGNGSATAEFTIAEAEEKDIDDEGDDVVDNGGGSKGSRKNVNTGDESLVTFWASLLGVSLIGLVMLFAARLRLRRKDR